MNKKNHIIPQKQTHINVQQKNCKFVKPKLGGKQNVKPEFGIQQNINYGVKPEFGIQQNINYGVKPEFGIQQNINYGVKPEFGIQQKNNNKFVKPELDVQIKKNYGVKPEFGIQQKINYGVKPELGIQQKNNSKFVKPEFGIQQKNNSKFVKPEFGIQQNINYGVKPEFGIQQKINYGVKPEFGIQQKNNSKFVKPELDVQIKKNRNYGVKGDMDGFGKEKGDNYTPRFVYLYKQTFLEEAVINKNDMNGLSPLSGYEHKYSPKYWNDNKNIKNNNNCYSYAVNYKNKKYGKPQPGYFAKFNHIQNKQYKCVSFFKRIINDIPSVYLTSFKQKCKKGFHKAFFAIDSNKNEHDYHFYRQDKNKLWSHKPGTTNVINYDADYKIIKNPYNANRNYSAYNYDKPCFFFCVNNKFGKTNAK